MAKQLNVLWCPAYELLTKSAVQLCDLMCAGTLEAVCSDIDRGMRLHLSAGIKPIASFKTNRLSESSLFLLQLIVQVPIR